MRIRVSTIGCLAFLLAAVPVLAQDPNIPPPAEGNAGPSALQGAGPLPITLPPNTAMTMEINAGEDDLLGVVKSLLRGVNSQSLGPVLDALDGGSGAHLSAALEKLLNNVDLSEVLANVHQLHIVGFDNLPPGNPQMRVQSFESQFESQGARRTLMMNQGHYSQVQMYSYPQRHGFAAVFIEPEGGVVVRADGYPDLSGVGPLLLLGLYQGTVAPMRPVESGTVESVPPTASSTDVEAAPPSSTSSTVTVTPPAAPTPRRSTPTPHPRPHSQAQGRAQHGGNH